MLANVCPTQLRYLPTRPPLLAPPACPLQLSAQCRPRQYNRRSSLTAPIDNCVQTPHLSLPRTPLPGTCFLHPTTWLDSSPHPPTRLACVSLSPIRTCACPFTHPTGMCVAFTQPPGTCSSPPPTYLPGMCLFHPHLFTWHVCPFTHPTLHLPLPSTPWDVSPPPNHLAYVPFTHPPTHLLAHVPSPSHLAQHLPTTHLPAWHVFSPLPLPTWHVSSQVLIPLIHLTPHLSLPPTHLACNAC
jgi:hypothetical protein